MIKTEEQKQKLQSSGFASGYKAVQTNGFQSVDSEKVNELIQKIKNKISVNNDIDNLYFTLPVTPIPEINEINWRSINMINDNEIRYYGVVKAETPLALHVLALNSNGILQKHNIFNPFCYVFARDNAGEASKLSYPISVRVSSPDSDSFYSPSKVFKSFDTFSNYAEKTFENCEASELVVNRPFISEHGGDERYSQSFFFYLATDYAMVHCTDNDDSFLINGDFSSLFDEAGLNKNVIYRLVNTGSRFFIENMFDADDERLAAIRSTSVENIFKTQDSLTSFLHGYRNGLHMPNKFGSVSFDLEAGYVSSPFNLGFMLGINGVSYLDQVRKTIGTANLKDVFKKQVAWAIASLLDEKSLERLESFSELHNTLCTSAKIEKFDLDSFKENVGEFTSTTPVSWASLTSNLSTVRDLLYSKIDNPHPSEKDKFYQKIVIPEEKPKPVRSLEASNLQYRIKDYNGDYFRVRLQAKNLKYSLRLVSEDGSEFSVLSKEVSNPEWDFTIKASEVGDYELFNSMLATTKTDNYSVKSQAGTKMMYAPLTVDDDLNLVSKHLGNVVIPASTIIRVAGDNLENNIQEMLDKLS